MGVSSASELRALYPGVSLSSEQLEAEQLVHITNEDLLGGGKKRKKKTYTKPKKTKKKHKKVKLSTLKYYKVEGDKVVRLRKPCPLGTGSMMAMHHDRYYCGKTGLTYVMKKDGETAEA